MSYTNPLSTLMGPSTILKRKEGDVSEVSVPSQRRQRKKVEDKWDREGNMKKFEQMVGGFVDPSYRRIPPWKETEQERAERISQRDARVKEFLAEIQEEVAEEEKAQAPEGKPDATSEKDQESEMARRRSQNERRRGPTQVAVDNSKSVDVSDMPWWLNGSEFLPDVWWSHFRTQLVKILHDFMDLSEENIPEKLLDKDLWMRAFTTNASSLILEENQEIMEFRGDKILSFFLSEVLHSNYPKITQSQRTGVFNHYVSNIAFRGPMEDLDLFKFIIATPSVLASFPKAYTADTYESFIGALYAGLGSKAPLIKRFMERMYFGKTGKDGKVLSRQKIDVERYGELVTSKTKQIIETLVDNHYNRKGNTKGIYILDYPAGKNTYIMIMKSALELMAPIMKQAGNDEWNYSLRARQTIKGYRPVRKHITDENLRKEPYYVLKKIPRSADINKDDIFYPVWMDLKEAGINEEYVALNEISGFMDKSDKFKEYYQRAIEKMQSQDGVERKMTYPIGFFRPVKNAKHDRHQITLFERVENDRGLIEMRIIHNDIQISSGSSSSQVSKLDTYIKALKSYLDAR